MATAGGGAAAAHARRVFSGIQPTGRLHLGNYLGAVRNWVRVQDEAVAAAAAAAAAAPSPGPATPSPGAPIFSIVDLHAMTMPYRPQDLRAGAREMAAALLACGIDPSASVVFLQSGVREHAELAWLLSCLTPLGWLQRMTQFKQKGGKDKAASPLGLLSYPVLQAADILLYRATHVPVGEDQAQHLELARDIAAAFNGRYGGPDFTLPLPATLTLPAGARVMSLRDGRKKMSKSEGAEDSRIHLGDSADAIAAKVRGAKTDSTPGFTYDPEGRPEKANLLAVYAAVSGEAVAAVAARHAGSSASAFKGELADLLVAHLAPIADAMARLKGDPAHLDAVLAAGAERARGIAAGTMEEVRARAGYA
jgi:tryptophanyl-tRNA synthetase